MTTTTLGDLKTKLERDGYLVVEDIFDPDVDFAQLYADWNAILDDLAEDLIAEGLLNSRHESLSFNDRFLAICGESGKNFPREFDITLPLKNIHEATPIYAGPGIFSVLTNENFLDVIEQLIGAEITSNPTQHLRMKLPEPFISEEGRREGLCTPAPFHQDQGVTLAEADDSDILTTWVAITDSTEELACMQIYPRTAGEELINHCPAGSPALLAKGQTTRGIPPKLMPVEPPTPVPVRAGGVLFFKGRLVHGSFENFSKDRLRISLDLRYQRSGAPTGRSAFPDFVARSRQNPSSELRDAARWQAMWNDTRDRLSRTPEPEFYRWSDDTPGCA